MTGHDEAWLRQEHISKINKGETKINKVTVWILGTNHINQIYNAYQRYLNIA